MEALHAETQSEANLAQVTGATYSQRGGLGPVQTRQQQHRQNGDDGDDYQKLDECEARRFGRSGYSSPLASQPSTSTTRLDDAGDSLDHGVHVKFRTV